MGGANFSGISFSCYGAIIMVSLVLTEQSYELRMFSYRAVLVSMGGANYSVVSFPCSGATYVSCAS